MHWHWTALLGVKTGLTELLQMKSYLVFFVLIFTPVFAQARDIFNFQSLGFSNDGKYYAFAESVVADGSGFATAKAAVMDVAGNSMVSFKEVVLEAANSTEAQALAQAIAGVKLSKYGFAAHEKNRRHTLDSHE
jgi:predicted secreted protein